MITNYKTYLLKESVEEQVDISLNQYPILFQISFNEIEEDMDTDLRLDAVDVNFLIMGETGFNRGLRHTFLKLLKPLDTSETVDEDEQLILSKRITIDMMISLDFIKTYKEFEDEYQHVYQKSFDDKSEIVQFFLDVQKFVKDADQLKMLL